MRHAIGLAEPRLFHLDSLRELVEQPTAPSEQDIDQADSDLVHEPAARYCRSMQRLRHSTAVTCSNTDGVKSSTCCLTRMIRSLNSGLSFHACCASKLSQGPKLMNRFGS